MCKIGDFVCSCDAGYWMLTAVYPKIATDDYSGSRVSWKKGDLLGQWMVLKKCLTPKFKPSIRAVTVDSSWVHKVDADTERAILQYFEEHPAFREKFDAAPGLPEPYITNCWIAMEEEAAEKLRKALPAPPERFTMDDVRGMLQEAGGKLDASADYLLNILSYPWETDEQGDLLYHGWELEKLDKN